jgi:hypothetical protein
MTAPGLTGNYDADEAFLATMAVRLPYLMNNISTSSRILNWFYNLGHRVKLPGTHTILADVKVKESSDIVWFDGDDELSAEYEAGDTQIAYGHHFGSVGIPMRLTDQLRNKDGRIVDLAQKRYNDVILALQEGLGRVILTGNGGKDPLGLLNAIEAAAIGSQTGTVGSITKNGNNWFNNQYVENTTEKFGDVVSTGLHRGIYDIIQLILKCRRNGTFPNGVFVGESVMLNVLRAQAALYGSRTTDGIPSSVAAGIPANAVILGVPIIEEKRLPANTILCLTSQPTLNPFGNQLGAGGGPLKELTPADIQGMFLGYHGDLDMKLTAPRPLSGVSMTDVSFVLFSQTNVYLNMLGQGRAFASGSGSYDSWS